MDSEQNTNTSTQPQHQQQWLQNIHPAPVKRVSPLYDLINMSPFEIIYGISDGRLSAQDRKVFDMYIRKCREYPEGAVKELFRKETARLFKHFLN